MIARLVRMQLLGRLRRPFPVFVLSVALGVAACGSDDDSASGGGDGGGPADEGRDIADDSGCMSCHRDGGGGIGPDWQGLAGSTVTLDDGSTVVADDAYLTLAITDPDAQIVEGYDIRMPSNDLGDDDVAAIVAYIQSLATPEPTS
jgi:cytochrome c oxidase subunit II